MLILIRIILILPLWFPSSFICLVIAVALVIVSIGRGLCITLVVLFRESAVILVTIVIIASCSRVITLIVRERIGVVLISLVRLFWDVTLGQLFYSWASLRVCPTSSAVRIDEVGGVLAV